MLHRAFIHILLVFMILGTGGAQAQETGTVPLYETPDTGGEAITTISLDSAFSLEGRNPPGTWLLVRTAGGVFGWAERSRFTLKESRRLAYLPVVNLPASEIEADRVKIYAGPGTDHPVVTIVPHSAWMVVEGRNFAGTWLRVRTNDGSVRGWVEQRHSLFTAENGLYTLPVISTLPEPKAEETAIILREGPGTDYSQAAAIDRGTALTIEGRDSSAAWLLVHTLDRVKRGWIASNEITLNEDTQAESLPVIDDPDNLEPLPPATIEVRAAPDPAAPLAASIPWQTRLMIEGRDTAGTWLYVHQAGAPDVRGWVEARDITLDNGVTVASLPVVEEQPPETAPVEVAAQPASDPLPAAEDPPAPAQPAPPAPADPPPYQPSGAPVDALVARLYSVPTVPTYISARTRQIMQRGSQLGMRRDVFSKVGDCHTDHLGFLHPLGVNEYELGPYGYLQTTIDYFSRTSPRTGVPNSFENYSFAAESSFTAAAVLDPTWADPAHCNPGESPLACEYRLVRPGVSIILLGTMDVTVYGAAEFDANLRRVVAETINRGIVPVLTTFPTDEHRFWAESLEFNKIILNIARDEQIPVINLWLATRSLPNYGLTEDHLHLTYKGERRLNTHGPDDRWISFSGDEQVWAHTLRNLVTLQTLALLR